MKVEPAMKSDPEGNVTGSIPFNAVSLYDGRIRTFSDEEQVYLVEKASAM